YQTAVNAVFNHHPNLRRPFKSSVWPTVTFNLGPHSVTKEHVDTRNYTAGACPITVLGSYDPMKGSHMVLWDLKLIIEFPPGSTIILPSSTLHHRNTTIQPHEHRYSFTQYASGAIFRWFDYGFWSTQRLLEEDPELFARMEMERDTCWAKSLNLFSTVDEYKLL
ncbi:hypothetical protein JAAARDRAFT_138096, partial [Jaapia argillacea MUCL 33604]